jgi:hypothetical protein
VSTTAEDLAKLRRMASVAAPGVLKDVFDEVVMVLPLVDSWTPVPTSGSAVCRYTPQGHKYDVRYQIGNLGNLVHELVHVAVNEAYGLDFLNYANPQARNVPDRDISEKGYCKNEEARQTKEMDQAKNQQNLQKLTDLIAWAEKSMELKPEQRDEVVKKLKYGQMSPQKEYDTVITHVLVWLFEWGYPIANTAPGKKPVVNALYEEVEKAVRAALDEREKEAPRTLLKASIEKRRKAMGYDD